MSSNQILLVVFTLLLVAWIAYGYFASKVVEQLSYSILDQTKEYEIRQLDPHLIAYTEVDGGFDVAGGRGFSIVANYIFGANTPNEKIKMTTPVVLEEGEQVDMTVPVVIQESENIDMTTPVVIEDKDEEKQILYFVLPSKYNLNNVPNPKDSRVQIEEVKERKVAVLRFSGFYSDSKFEEKKLELKSYLDRDGVSYTKFSSSSYNPPWTPPFMRRLEVWAEIE